MEQRYTDPIYQITFQQLRYFLSVAENLSFTKAALENHVAQTAVSQNIIALEKNLNLRLFKRDKRSVYLTEAGKFFYQKVKKVFCELDAYIVQAQLLNKGYDGNLNIGFQGSHEKEILPELFKYFKKLYPHIAITLIQDGLHTLNYQLAQSKLDIIFTLTSEPAAAPDIQELSVASYPLCAVVPSSHPLADQSKLNRIQFQHDPIIFIKPARSSGTYETMINDCRHAGFSPVITTYTENIDAALLLIEAGMGISFFPSCCNTHTPNLSFIELDDDTSVTLAVRWSSKSDNPCIPLFIDSVRNFIQQKGAIIPDC